MRLTAEEHKALAEQARAAGLSMSDLVRFRLFEDDGRPRVIVDSEALKALYRDQRRLGGLLNQVLRHANTRRQDFPILAAQTQKLLEQLGETTQQISDFLADARKSA